MNRVVFALLASFLVGAGLGACSPARSKCANVICSGNRVCDESSGACLPVDGGTPDAGGQDAGQQDGGVTGCVPACTGSSKCDLTTGQCVECLSDADCACPVPVCSAAKVCSAAAPDAGLAIPPAGETCETAPALRTCGGTVTFSVDLTNARDDVEARCLAPSSGGHDVLYSLVLDATFDVRVTARPPTGSRAQPIVSLRRACDAAQELACSDGLGGSASIYLKSLAAGSYTLVIDSYDAASAAGVVDVTVEYLPATLPPNETCGTAAPLPTDGTSVRLELAGASDDLAVSCNPRADSPEGVYRLDLAAPGDLSVTVSGSPDAGVDPVVALLAAPCESAATIACVDYSASLSETLTARNLDAGTYFLVVENYGRPGAGVDVQARLSAPTPPPPNDTCAAPRAINFPSGMNSVTFTIDTSAALDDMSGSCNAEPDSPEVVYSLTLGATRDVTVSTVAASGASADAVIYLRSAPCDGSSGSTELACADALPPGPDTFTRTLPAGTYYLFVEGYGPGGAGPTEVTVTLAP